MQKITPFLWFDGNAEEAASFYISVFKNAKILRTARYREGSPGQAGMVMTVNFTIDGQEFVALNGGPEYKFTPAISFAVHCETQAEVDEYWTKLCEGGQPLRCGWITDKFGVTWQIVPRILIDLLTGADEKKAKKAMEAMLQMTKIDIAALQK